VISCDKLFKANRHATEGGNSEDLNHGLAIWSGTCALFDRCAVYVCMCLNINYDVNVFELRLFELLFNNNYESERHNMSIQYTD
jgi:hypothetical protein